MASTQVSNKTAQKLLDISAQLQGWKVVRTIGSGSFGTVFEISRGRERSALKVIPIPLTEAELHEKELEMGHDQNLMHIEFQRQVDRVREKEIAVLEMCRGQQNIVQLYESEVLPDPERPICFYVLIRMEMLTELTDWLYHGKTQKDVLMMFRDIAHALAFLESRRMLHRDIKRANIMVSANGTYKLTDFGEARDILSKNAASTKAGTPYFMAPEVANGNRYDNRADIYSLAMTVYHCLYSLRYPFQDRTGISRRTSQDAYNLRIEGRAIDEIPDVDPRFNRILLRCLAYDPQSRYPSASMLLEDIEKLLASRNFQDGQLYLPSRSSSSGAETTGGSSSHGLKAWAIVLIVVGSLLLLIGIVLAVLQPWNGDHRRVTPTETPVQEETGEIQVTLYSGSGRANAITEEDGVFYLPYSPTFIVECSVAEGEPDGEWRAILRGNSGRIGEGTSCMWTIQPLQENEDAPELKEDEDTLTVQYWVGGQLKYERTLHFALDRDRPESVRAEASDFASVVVQLRDRRTNSSLEMDEQTGIYTVPQWSYVDFVVEPNEVLALETRPTDGGGYQDFFPLESDKDDPYRFSLQTNDWEIGKVYLTGIELIDRSTGAETKLYFRMKLEANPVKDFAFEGKENYENATVKKDEELEIKWSAEGDVGRYVVLVSKDGGEPSKTIIEKDAPRVYTIKGEDLALGSVYEITVQAFSLDNVTEEPDAQDTISGITRRPEPVEGLTFDSYAPSVGGEPVVVNKVPKHDNVVITWKPQGDVKSYNITVSAIDPTTGEVSQDEPESCDGTSYTLSKDKLEVGKETVVQIDAVPWSEAEGQDTHTEVRFAPNPDPVTGITVTVDGTKTAEAFQLERGRLTVLAWSAKGDVRSVTARVKSGEEALLETNEEAYAIDPDKLGLKINETYVLEVEVDPWSDAEGQETTASWAFTVDPIRIEQLNVKIDGRSLSRLPKVLYRTGDVAISWDAGKADVGSYVVTLGAEEISVGTFDEQHILTRETETSGIIHFGNMKLGQEYPLQLRAVPLYEVNAEEEGETRSQSELTLARQPVEISRFSAGLVGITRDSDGIYRFSRDLEPEVAAARTGDVKEYIVELDGIPVEDSPFAAEGVFRYLLTGLVDLPFGPENQHTLTVEAIPYENGRFANGVEAKRTIRFELEPIYPKNVSLTFEGGEESGEGVVEFPKGSAAAFSWDVGQGDVSGYIVRFYEDGDLVEERILAPTDEQSVSFEEMRKLGIDYRIEVITIPYGQDASSEAVDTFPKESRLFRLETEDVSELAATVLDADSRVIEDKDGEVWLIDQSAVDGEGLAHFKLAYSAAGDVAAATFGCPELELADTPFGEDGTADVSAALELGKDRTIVVSVSPYYGERQIVTATVALRPETITRFEPRIVDADGKTASRIEVGTHAEVSAEDIQGDISSLEVVKEESTGAYEIGEDGHIRILTDEGHLKQGEEYTITVEASLYPHGGVAEGVALKRRLTYRMKPESGAYDRETYGIPGEEQRYDAPEFPEDIVQYALLREDGTPVDGNTAEAESGTYSLDEATGEVVFTPAEGYTGTPAPIILSGKTEDGAEYEATYQPTVVDNVVKQTIAREVYLKYYNSDDLADTREQVLVLAREYDLMDNSPELNIDLPLSDWYVFDAEEDQEVRADSAKVEFEGEPKSLTDLGWIPDREIIPALHDGISLEDAGNVKGWPANLQAVEIVFSPQAPTANGDLSTFGGRGQVQTAQAVARLMTLTTAEGKPNRIISYSGNMNGYAVDTVTGEVTFTPEEGFTGDPEPIVITAVDLNNCTTTITYQPHVKDNLELASLARTIQYVAENGGTIVDPTTGYAVSEDQQTAVLQRTGAVDRDTGEISSHSSWSIVETTPAVDSPAVEGWDPDKAVVESICEGDIADPEADVPELLVDAETVTYRARAPKAEPIESSGPLNEAQQVGLGSSFHVQTPTKADGNDNYLVQYWLIDDGREVAELHAEEGTYRVFGDEHGWWLEFVPTDNFYGEAATVSIRGMDGNGKQCETTFTAAVTTEPVSDLQIFIDNKETTEGIVELGFRDRNVLIRAEANGDELRYSGEILQEGESSRPLHFEENIARISQRELKPGRVNTITIRAAALDGSTEESVASFELLPIKVSNFQIDAEGEGLARAGMRNAWIVEKGVTAATIKLSANGDVEHFAVDGEAVDESYEIDLSSLTLKNSMVFTASVTSIEGETQERTMSFYAKPDPITEFTVYVENGVLDETQDPLYYVQAGDDVRIAWNIVGDNQGVMFGNRGARFVDNDGTVNVEAMEFGVQYPVSLSIRRYIYGVSQVGYNRTVTLCRIPREVTRFDVEPVAVRAQQEDSGIWRLDRNEEAQLVVQTEGEIRGFHFAGSHGIVDADTGVIHVEKMKPGVSYTVKAVLDLEEGGTLAYGVPDTREFTFMLQPIPITDLAVNIDGRNVDTSAETPYPVAYGSSIELQAMAEGDLEGFLWDDSGASGDNHIVQFDAMRYGETYAVTVTAQPCEDEMEAPSETVYLKLDMKPISVFQICLNGQEASRDADNELVEPHYAVTFAVQNDDVTLEAYDFWGQMLDAAGNGIESFVNSEFDTSALSVGERYTLIVTAVPKIAALGVASVTEQVICIVPLPVAARPIDGLKFESRKEGVRLKATYGGKSTDLQFYYKRNEEVTLVKKEIDDQEREKFDLRRMDVTDGEEIVFPLSDWTKNGVSFDDDTWTRGHSYYIEFLYDGAPFGRYPEETGTFVYNGTGDVASTSDEVEDTFVPPMLDLGENAPGHCWIIIEVDDPEASAPQGALMDVSGEDISTKELTNAVRIIREADGASCWAWDIASEWADMQSIFGRRAVGLYLNVTVGQGEPRQNYEYEVSYDSSRSGYPEGVQAVPAGYRLSVTTTDMENATP